MKRLGKLMSYSPVATLSEQGFYNSALKISLIHEFYLLYTSGYILIRSLLPPLLFLSLPPHTHALLNFHPSFHWRCHEIQLPSFRCPSLVGPLLTRVSSWWVTLAKQIRFPVHLKLIFKLASQAMEIKGQDCTAWTSHQGNQSNGRGERRRKEWFQNKNWAVHFRST